MDVCEYGCECISKYIYIRVSMRETCSPFKPREPVIPFEDMVGQFPCGIEEGKETEIRKK